MNTATPRSLLVTATFKVNDENEALDVHLAVMDQDMDAAKAVETYIWSGRNVTAILELASRVGIPDGLEEELAKVAVVYGTPRQLVDLIECVGSGDPVSDAARKHLLDKLATAEPGAWMDAVRRSGCFFDSERKALLAKVS